MTNTDQITPELYLVKAFTNTPVGGNTAGVVLFADRLPRERRQKIAAMLELSETAFVSASDQGDVKVEFYTPVRQIPHCGHATVAAFSLLWQKGLLKNGSAIKESIEGPRLITFDSNKVYQSQLAPSYTSLDTAGIVPHDIIDALGLPEGFEFEHPPVIANTGVSFLLVPLPDAVALRGLQLDQAQIKELSDRNGLVGFYVFTIEAGEADASARMFAPSYGIPEESATGMAAGPLACYLHDFLHIHKTNFLIHQGYLMGHPSPSQIEVQLELDEHGNITGLRVGGAGIVIRQMEMGEFWI
ncbi:PhzF family phenazine biosynthesis protein [Pontibacter sp. JH31]|uniref:PhzF family phenazine biosynthesis protein n=1 Tax=Pontibacter aquaedesilientis TaxID=2766980 RepID=A0ABR7XH90_9BACT|nr:PhzF family phenazine biosynthesis protein [Pontibacter aquaedesilientis]MBD1397628.1 PhzF family phenazine biosynthesis protein [Pontibacter aquaedesilientis]